MDSVQTAHMSVHHQSCFSAIFVKGDNFCDFLFASLDSKVLPELGLLLKERIFPLTLLHSERAKFWSF